MRADRLASCLCLTQRRVELLRKSVTCFLDQTYQPCELVVVYQSDDDATRDYLGELGAPSVRPVEVPASPRLTTGALRNISLQAAGGYYVATWDDDDWHAPTRLAEQIGAMASSGKAGCVLSHLLLYDGKTKATYISARRAWENSLVAERTAVPPYPDMRRGSDTAVIDRMLSERRLVVLDRPDLYVYIYHGENLWGREHWEENVLRQACPVPDRDSERMRSFIETGQA